MIFENYYIMVPIIAWLIAQTLKVIIESIKEKKFKFSRIIGNGGMPSGHAAIVSSLAVVTLMNDGVLSSNFGIVAVFALIILADAIGVRYETGKQAKAINEIVEDLNENDIEVEIRQLKEQVGHRPTEVLAGTILGIVVAYVIVGLKLL